MCDKDAYTGVSMSVCPHSRASLFRRSRRNQCITASFPDDRTLICFTCMTTHCLHDHQGKLHPYKVSLNKGFTRHYFTCFVAFCAMNMHLPVGLPHRDMTLPMNVQLTKWQDPTIVQIIFVYTIVFSIRLESYSTINFTNKTSLSVPGFEPGIFCSVGRRVIHCANEHSNEELVTQ